MNTIFKSAKPLGLAAGLLLAFVATASAQQSPSRPIPASPTAAQSDADTPNAARGERRGRSMRGACHTDLAQFCGDAAAGGGGKRQCLEANLTKLSATCQTALTQQRQLQAQFGQACRGDMQALCKDIAPGRGAKLQCLRQKSAEVSPTCAQALASLPDGGRRGKRSGERVIAPKT